MLLSVVQYLDKALEYDRLAQNARKPLDQQRHANWAAYYRFMAQVGKLLNAPHVPAEVPSVRR
jgi:hypothetical protein